MESPAAHPRPDVSDSTAIDSWSVLHLLAGFVCTYLLRWSIGVSVLLHQVFELWQNSPSGLRSWAWMTRAGVRPVEELELGPEEAVNTAMDTLLFTVGAIFGSYLRDQQQQPHGASADPHPPPQPLVPAPG